MWLCVSGGLGVLWCVAWMLLVSDTPLQHKRISAVERDYIVESLKGQVDETGEKDVSHTTSHNLQSDL